MGCKASCFSGARQYIRYAERLKKHDNAVDGTYYDAIKNNNQGGNKLARSNYKFNKRQKELARMKKKELKRQRKLDKNAINSEEDPNQSQNEGEDLSA